MKLYLLKMPDKFVNPYITGVPMLNASDEAYKDGLVLFKADRKIYVIPRENISMVEATEEELIEYGLLSEDPVDK